MTLAIYSEHTLRFSPWLLSALEGEVPIYKNLVNLASERYGIIVQWLRTSSNTDDDDESRAEKSLHFEASVIDCVLICYPRLFG